MADTLIKKTATRTFVRIRGDGGDGIMLVIYPDRQAHIRHTFHDNGKRVKSGRHIPSPVPVMRRYLCPDWATENGLGWAFD